MPPPTMAPSTGSAAEAGVDTAAVTADTASAAASMVFFNIVPLQSDNYSTGISYNSGSHTINARGARSVDTDLRAKIRFAIDRDSDSVDHLPPRGFDLSAAGLHLETLALGIAGGAGGFARRI